MKAETQQDREDEDIPGPNWAWRRKVRGHPVWGTPYRIAVGVIGTVVVIIGLITVPLPGQGWLTVLLGVAILATEFAWAERLLERGRDWLRRWNEWLLAQGWPTRLAVGAATFALVVGTLWVVFRVTGVPTYLPDGIENFMRAHLAL